VLFPGTKPLPNVNSCKNGEQYWYEPSAYRLIPYSSCEGGIRLDHGTPHVCPRFGAHGMFFWMFVVLIPFAFTALVGYYYYRRSGLARGLVSPLFLLILTLTCVSLQNHPSKLGCSTGHTTGKISHTAPVPVLTPQLQ
jgi:hypothetical protein